MIADTEVLAVFEISSSTRKEIGSVVLNGYSIEDENPIGLPQGTLRSFRIVRGSFWEGWDAQRPLSITTPDGGHAKIRIAAMPVDRGSYGLIEFL